MAEIAEQESGKGKPLGGAVFAKGGACGYEGEIKGSGSNQTAACAFYPAAGVDDTEPYPYIAVHRRAANGVGGLLLHLLTVGGC